MLSRLISNLVLGFFVTVLVVVYGITRQTPTYHIKDDAQSVAESADNAMPQELSEETPKKLAVASLAHLMMPDGSKLQVMVADDEHERDQGLSGTDTLAEGSGMFFVFDSLGSHGIWMKDMKYDLDIIWLDADGRIVKIVEDAPAPKPEDQATMAYSNSEPAMYVLEVKAGEVERLGLMAGDQIKVY